MSSGQQDAEKISRRGINMDVKLTDAELVIMDALWENGELPAIELAKKARDERGWEKNTAYTMITRLIKKGAVIRSDPGFICRAAVDRETVRRNESREIVDKLFCGSLNLFARAFLQEKKLSSEEIEELRKIIDDN